MAGASITSGTERGFVSKGSALRFQRNPAQHPCVFKLIDEALKCLSVQSGESFSNYSAVEDTQVPSGFSSGCVPALFALD